MMAAYSSRQGKFPLPEKIDGMLVIKLRRESDGIVQDSDVDSYIRLPGSLPSEAVIAHLRKSEARYQRIAVIILVVQFSAYLVLGPIHCNGLVTGGSVTCTQFQLINPVHIVLDKTLFRYFPAHGH